MSHHQQRSPVRLQILLQPLDHLTVQVVGGLVHEQHVKILRQHLRQGHPPSLAPGELR